MIDPTKLTAEKGVTMEREAGWYKLDGLALYRYFDGYIWDGTMTEFEYALTRPIGPRIEEPEDE